MRAWLVDGPRRQIEGSLPNAKKTAEIMRLLVTTQRHADSAALIDDVRAVGYKIQAAKPVGEWVAVYWRGWRGTCLCTD